MNCEATLPGTKEWHDTHGNFCAGCEQIINKIARSPEHRHFVKKVEQLVGVKDEPDTEQTNP